MFRFTIRDVLWLTVVVAMGVAWHIEHKRTVANAETVKEQALQEQNQTKVVRKALEDEREVLWQEALETYRRSQKHFFIPGEK